MQYKMFSHLGVILPNIRGLLPLVGEDMVKKTLSLLPQYPIEILILLLLGVEVVGDLGYIAELVGDLG